MKKLWKIISDYWLLALTLLTVAVLMVAVGTTLAGCQRSTTGPQLEHQLEVRAPAVDTLVVEWQTFGSPEAPLTSGWAIWAADTYVEVRHCTFWLDGAHGVGVFAVSRDTPGPLIQACTFNCADSTNTYVIGVGPDYGPAVHYLEGTRVVGCTLRAPEADTPKHMLFLGYGNRGALVSDNTVVGGGYGIGLKGCEQSEVRGNRVYWTEHQALVDKAGFEVSWHDNLASVRSDGYCFRVTNDGQVQAARSSSWWRNVGFHAHPWKPVFVVGTPVPASELLAFSNLYHHDRPGSAYALNGDFMTLQEVQQLGLEEGSELRPMPQGGTPKEEYTVERP